MSGDLLVQRCDACGSAQLYPRPLCIRCGSSALRWEQASGQGTIYSVTTVRIQVVPDRAPPYVIALVELDEGPRLLAEASAELAIGDRVLLHWRSTGTDSFPVLQCRSAGAEPASVPFQY